MAWAQMWVQHFGTAFSLWLLGLPLFSNFNCQVSNTPKNIWQFGLHQVPWRLPRMGWKGRFIDDFDCWKWISKVSWLLFWSFGHLFNRLIRFFSPMHTLTPFIFGLFWHTELRSKSPQNCNPVGDRRRFFKIGSNCVLTRSAWCLHWPLKPGRESPNWADFTLGHRDRLTKNCPPQPPLFLLKRSFDLLPLIECWTPSPGICSQRSTVFASVALWECHRSSSGWWASTHASRGFPHLWDIPSRFLESSTSDRSYLFFCIHWLHMHINSHQI